MLGFEAVVKSMRHRVKRSCLFPLGLPFSCFLLSRTAMISAFVPSTVQRGSTDSHALGLFEVALVTDCT